MDTLTLFLGGDLMTGRGVDQILAHPSDPRVDEPFVRDARDYVRLAERAHGPVGRGHPPGYVWGDALGPIASADARIVNLETSVTSSDDAWPAKDVRYRMHPGNVDVLTVARIDVCSLANNHLLDYGYAGLEETLRVLGSAGVHTTGAGLDLEHAARPAIVEVPGKGARVIVLGLGCADSGIPAAWAATPTRPGVHLVRDPEHAACSIESALRDLRRPRDLVVASIHWGSNWGHAVPGTHRELARLAIEAGADLVHGHSSHHPRPLEIIDGKLVLYGCGELLDDYEGIRGYEAFRGDLVLLYFATYRVSSREVVALRMAPMRIRAMRLEPAGAAESSLLARTLARTSRPFGVRVESTPAGLLARW